MADGFESAPDHVQIEPGAAQPCRHIHENGGKAPHLGGCKQAAEEQSEGDEQQRRQQQGDEPQQQTRVQRQAEEKRRDIARDSLQQRQGQHGQGIPENVLGARHRAGEQTCQKCAGPVVRDQHAEKQGEKGQPEHRHAGGERRDIEHLARHIRNAALHHGNQQNQHHRKPDAEQGAEGIPPDLPSVAGRKGQTPHAGTSSSVRRRKASSSAAAPVSRLISSAVPSASIRPRLMMPIRSASASASSR